MELDLFLLFSSLPTTFIFFCVYDADRDDDAATACNGGVTVLLRFIFFIPPTSYLNISAGHFLNVTTRGPMQKLFIHKYSNGRKQKV